MRWALAAAVVAAAAGVAVATARGSIARRRLPFLRIVFAALAGVSLGIRGGPGGVALVGVFAAVAATVVAIVRRHGTAAWPGSRAAADPAPTPAERRDPQLHRNGIRRPRRPPDPLQEHEAAILGGLACHGVVRVFTFGGSPVVWLGTATDAQLEALGRRSPLLHEVRAILRAEGVDPAVVQDVRTAALSAEAVEREHRGDWFRAMR